MPVAAFVREMGGRKVISKVLLANNGIAAVKCIKSVRKFAYELFRNELAIQFVAMVSNCVGVLGSTHQSVRAE